MRRVFAAVLACATLFAATEGALAEAKKKGGLTCAQRCSAYCNAGNRHPNCFDRCSTLRCR